MGMPDLGKGTSGQTLQAHTVASMELQTGPTCALLGMTAYICVCGVRCAEELVGHKQAY